MESIRNLKIGEIDREVIERYLWKKEYVVRIRLDKETKTKLKINVYYNGRKSFGVSSSKLVLDDATFFKKGNKVFALPKKESIVKLLNLGFSFKMGFSINSADKYYKDGYRYRIKVEPSTAKEESDSYYLKNSSGINEKMSIILNELKKVKKDAIHVFDKSTMTNYFYIKDNEIDYDDLCALLEVGIFNTVSQKGITKIDFNEKIVGSKSTYQSYEYDEIDEIMEERVEAYNKGVLDKEEASEKTYQQLLMNKMFDSNERQELFNVEDCPFKDSYAFEMEYNLYEDNREDRDKESKKGRVDNIFIKDNKVLFTEIKYDEGVIDGPNGIHKHLIDLINGFEKNDEALKEIYDYVCDYNDVLSHFESKKNFLIKNVDRFENEDALKEFIIICGYSEDKKVTVFDKIKRVYNITGKDAGVEKEYEITLDNKQIKLEELKCYELVNILNNKYKCDVNIYLVDDMYTRFENLMNELLK